MTLEMFALHVLKFINPNFENPDFNDPNSDASLNKLTVIQFAKKCRLTPKEFLMALDLVPRGELTTVEDRNGEDYERPLKLFARVDERNLIEIETAYGRYKVRNKQYERGKSEIKAFLEPPKPELTPEQLKAERIDFYKTDFARLQREGKVMGTVIFYDLIKKNGLEKVNLKFVENVLDKFQPETTEPDGLSRSTEPQQIKIPKVRKHDAKVFFIDALVAAYFEKEKLKELSESGFVEYWENIFEKTQKTEECK